MERQQVIDNIRQVAASVLPKGSRLYLYGSPTPSWRWGLRHDFRINVAR